MPLQYAASRLLRQRTQEWAGEAEKEKGIRQFHKLKRVLGNLEEKRSVLVGPEAPHARFE